MGQEKLILGHNEMNYGTEQGDFLGQEKLKLGHNKANYGRKQEVFGIPRVPNFLYTYMETSLRETYKNNSICDPERFLPSGI